MAIGNIIGQVKKNNAEENNKLKMLSSNRNSSSYMTPVWHFADYNIEIHFSVNITDENIKSILNVIDTSELTDAKYMFDSLNKVTEIDLSIIDLKSVTIAERMFYNCKNLSKLDISTMNLGNISNRNNMFYNVPTSCLIYVKDETSLNWMQSKFPDYINIKIKE